MPRPRMAVGTYGDINTKQLEDGRWRAFTRVRDLDGQTRQVSKTGKSKSGSQTALKEELANRFVGRRTSELSPDMTLTALGKVWLRKKKTSGDVEDSSLETYEWAFGIIKKHVGQLTVQETTLEVVDNLIETLMEQKPATARLVRTVLGGMLGHAAKRGVIAANPVRSLDKMARPKKDVRALKVEDIPLIRAGILRWQNRPGPGPRDKDLGDIVDVFLSSGFRIGEVLALR